MTIIACLHAARSNIEVYEQALAALEYEDVQLLHRVESELLQAVVNANAITPAIIDATNRAIDELCDAADLVIITCTTLGVVGGGGRKYSKPVLRVDGTLAKQASRYHGRALVLCTAPTTLAPTKAMFEAWLPPERLTIELIDGAWDIFNSGDMDAYHQAIAHHIESRPECPLACIVLAQASMAGAEHYINSTLAILSGPQVTLQAALDELM